MLRPHRDYVAAYIRCRVHPKVTKMIELFGGTITNIDGEWMAN
jgi:hypothetical protein